jgi:hypothetical protein
MRISQRHALLRRIDAAEAVISKRVVSRAIELLADEHRSGDWRVQKSIEATMSRVAAHEIDGMTPTDIVRPLLGDLAKSVPDVARRIALAVGIDPPSASVSQ